MHICIWQDYFINFQDIQFVFLLFQVNFWIKWDVNLIYYISSYMLEYLYITIAPEEYKQIFQFPFYVFSTDIFKEFT